MLPGHPPPSAVNVFFYAQQNQIIRVKTAKPCQKSVFNWIDRKNFRIRYRVRVTQPDGRRRTLPPGQLFPDSLRATLLQSYLHEVRWMALPKVHLPSLRLAILQRLANRFCRRHPVAGYVFAWSQIQRVRPGRKAQPARQRFLMRFRCAETQAQLFETMLGQRLGETSHSSRK